MAASALRVPSRDRRGSSAARRKLLGGPDRAARRTAVLIRVWQLLAAAARLIALAILERRRSVPPERSALPTALTQTLDSLGPAFVKLGQALSLRADVLPPAYLTALAALQDHAQPVPPNDVRLTIEDALGMRLAAVFATFDERPVAAASVAQVHRATLAGGRTVAVKVRRPDIGPVIDRDLRLLAGAATVAALFSARLRRHRPRAVVEDVWRRMRLELDFRLEANNVRALARGLSANLAVYVPAVVDEWSRESVLVQEFSTGQPLATVESASERHRLANVLLDAYLEQWLRLGLFHADPHPGNLFVMADGRLCFHDFGQVGLLERRQRQALIEVLQALAVRDAGWLVDAATDLGLLVAGPDRHALEAVLAELVDHHLNRPLRDISLPQLLLDIARNARSDAFELPHGLLVLLRAIVLLESTLRQLDPDLDPLAAIRRRAPELLAARDSEETLRVSWAEVLQHAAFALSRTPGVLASAFRRMNRGDAAWSVSLRTPDAEHLGRRIQRGANNIALSLVSAGLLVAASSLLQHGGGPIAVFRLPWLALAGYASAAIVIVRLLFNLRAS